MSATYVEFINKSIQAAIAAQPRVVVYGQNVSTGSCLSGLSRNFDKLANCTVINTTNSEGTLVGMGFGLMLRGVSSIFFMKQQDFLLLGVDQLTNTMNALRHRTLTASFTIVAIVVDSGWEGPQSCLNNLADFSSFSRVPAFAIADRAEAEAIIPRHLPAPGLRLVGLSQRIFRMPIDDTGVQHAYGDDAGVLRHAEGSDATIVAFNLALPQARSVYDDLAARGLRPSLFSVPATMPETLEPILQDIERSGRLVIVDDSKSVHSPSHLLVSAARMRVPTVRLVEQRRAWSIASAAPNADVMPLDMAAVRNGLGCD